MIMKDNLKKNRTRKYGEMNLWSQTMLILQDLLLVFENNEVSNILSRTYCKTGLICNIVNFKIICKVQFNVPKILFSCENLHGNICMQAHTHARTHTPEFHDTRFKHFTAHDLLILLQWIKLLLLPLNLILIGREYAKIDRCEFIGNQQTAEHTDGRINSF